jgi:NAD(P)-dependent dehydrogenase (short-subunit alcohol dehydrogenase family)
LSPDNQPNQPLNVVVTGATAGVGRATVRELARRGARIGVMARSSEGMNDTLDEIARLGGEGIDLVADVADHEQVEAGAQRMEEELGPIDVWINNAMSTIFAPFADTEPADFRRATEVTYLGFVWGTRAALKRMVPRDSGVIVQVGSALAYRSIPLQAAYCGAKHAIVGFTDSLRSELLHDGSAVKLTVVHLPAVNTTQFGWCKTVFDHMPQPVPPIYQPEVAARAIVDAADGSRREVLLALSTRKAIWGQMFIPGLLDRYLAGQGYSGQKAARRVDPATHPSNLYHSVPGHRAHGMFDDRAHDSASLLSSLLAAVRRLFRGLLAGRHAAEES